ncbi:MAG: hypothetical protein L6R41_004587 [Letrouitia leprolyta]|nr:MAG: hypothetical protein L6R41_004587 [Letrouitia leprolyta]
MKNQVHCTACTSTSSSKPILPKLDIPQTDISMFSSATTSSDTTPKPCDNMVNTSPITAINVSPITAIFTRRHSNDNSIDLPCLERQNSAPRFRGTRLSDYDSDDSDASSMPSWRAESPRRGESVEGSEEPDNSGNSGNSLNKLLQREFERAWRLNQSGSPRSEGSVWQGIVASGVGKVWAEDLEVVSKARMGVKRVEGASSGSGSPLRFGVSVEDLGGGYRMSRFGERDVDGGSGVGEGWRADGSASRDEERERDRRKRTLGKRMWKKILEWKK